jgi:hypothetical protein
VHLMRILLTTSICLSLPSTHRVSAQATTEDLNALLNSCRHEGANLSRCGPSRVRRLILGGADVRSRGRDGQTPLRVALANGLDASVIRVLIDAGADVGSSELLSLAYPRVDVMRMLLQAGTPADAPFGPEGWTPLMRAVQDLGTQDPELEALRFLLEAGANPARRMKDGRSALSVASERLGEMEEYYRKQYPSGTVPEWVSDAQLRGHAVLGALRAASGQVQGRGLPARGQSGPPRPFIDSGVCPGEGCSYGHRIADAAIVVYTTQGDTSHRAFQLAPDEGYEAETGNVWVRKPGVVSVTTTWDLQVDVSSRTPQTMSLTPGEQLYILTPLGEGRFHVWVRGQIFEVSQCWLSYFASMPEDRTCGKLIDSSKGIEWWIRVRNSKGQTGWMREHLMADCAPDEKSCGP